MKGRDMGVIQSVARAGSLRGVTAGVLAVAFLIGGCGDGADAPRPLGAEGAHEHGVARVDLSIDGNSGVLAFRAPAAEIYGFERLPQTEEEEARREAGLRAVRERMGEAVRFAAELECTLRAREVADDHGEHRHDGHGDHDHHDLGHDHAGHAAHVHVQDHVHDPGAQAGGEDAHQEHEPAHIEVEATFDVSCAGPLDGSRLTLAFDEVFPGIVDVDLQVVGERSFGGRYRAAGARIDL